MTDQSTATLRTALQAALEEMETAGARLHLNPYDVDAGRDFEAACRRAREAFDAWQEQRSRERWAK